MVTITERKYGGEKFRTGMIAAVKLGSRAGKITFSSRFSNFSRNHHLGLRRSPWKMKIFLSIIGVLIKSNYRLVMEFGNVFYFGCPQSKSE
jgi:hypothetical protein